MRIQHNLAAMNVSRNMKMNTVTSASTMEKLSSGYRINRSADDAAGLSVSEKMRKLIRGLTQAGLNCQEGISLVQTAEGALHEVHDMLQRMNVLAIQSANGTNTKAERSALQQEFAYLQDEIDRVSDTTKFNDTHLFTRGSSSTETTTVFRVNRAAGGNITTTTNYSEAASFGIVRQTRSPQEVVVQASSVQWG